MARGKKAQAFFSGLGQFFGHFPLSVHATFSLPCHLCLLSCFHLLTVTFVLKNCISCQLNFLLYFCSSSSLLLISDTSFLLLFPFSFALIGLAFINYLQPVGMLTNSTVAVSLAKQGTVLSPCTYFFRFFLYSELLSLVLSVNSR